MCENYERLKVINKSNELFVDAYCHTMLADREVILSHMTSHGKLCLSRKHVQSEDCSLKWSILQHLPFFEDTVLHELNVSM